MWKVCWKTTVTNSFLVKKDDICQGVSICQYLHYKKVHALNPAVCIV